MAKRQPNTGNGFTPEKVAKFIGIVRECGNVTRAAAGAGWSRQLAYDYREKHPDFAKAWDQALEASLDELEEECRRRAFEGVLEPVYHRGAQVGEVRKYSDTLLMFMLNGRRGNVFNRQRHEVTGADGGPITITFGLSAPGERKGKLDGVIEPE